MWAACVAAWHALSDPELHVGRCAMVLVILRTQFVYRSWHALNDPEWHVCFCAMFLLTLRTQFVSSVGEVYTWTASTRLAFVCLGRCN